MELKTLSKALKGFHFSWVMSSIPLSLKNVFININNIYNHVH